MPPDQPETSSDDEIAALWARAEPAKYHLMLSGDEHETRKQMDDFLDSVTNTNLEHLYPSQRCYVCEPLTSGAETVNGQVAKHENDRSDEAQGQPGVGRRRTGRLVQLIDYISSTPLKNLQRDFDHELAACGNADWDKIDDANALDTRVREVCRHLVVAQCLLSDMQKLGNKDRTDILRRSSDRAMVEMIKGRRAAFDEMHEKLHQSAVREVDRLRRLHRDEIKTHLRLKLKSIMLEHATTRAAELGIDLYAPSEEAPNSSSFPILLSID
ncbi:unnamed protein product [Peniophora sp. CBMAI 1063]|nr:unnamed protein product [Peniophora sp. CBMAI 1063]